MVKYEDNFYDEYYLPLLLYSGFKPCDVFDMSFNEQVEKYGELVNRYGETFDFDRIEIPEEVLSNTIGDEMLLELIKNHRSEFVDYIIDYHPELLDEYFDDYDEMKEKLLKLPTNKLFDMIVLDFSEVDDLLYNIDEEKYHKIHKEFIVKILKNSVVYEPKIFDIDVVLSVGLIPFRIIDSTNGCDVEVLSSLHTDEDIRVRLDTYQILVSGTIPSDSLYFSRPYVFRSVIGDELFEEVKSIIGE